MKKKAFELSVNFLVMLILAIAMFSVGILILKVLFSDLDIFQKKLQEKIEEEIRLEMESNQIYISSKHIEKGGHDDYFIGIRNDLDYTDTFYIHTECDFAAANDQTIICDDDLYNDCGQFDSWIGFNPIGPLTIKRFEQDIPIIYVIVPKTAVKGTYEFDVRVCTDNPCTDQYLTTQRMDVIVD